MKNILRVLFALVIGFAIGAIPHSISALLSDNTAPKQYESLEYFPTTTNPTSIAPQGGGSCG